MSENQPRDEPRFDDSQPAIGSFPGVLRRFIKQRTAVERCDMCNAEVQVDHAHLVEPATRRIVCACQACAILFSGSADQRYRRIPRRIIYLPEFQLTDAQWESLLIPIGMAFFYRSSVTQKVIALYPSPAGATESLLDFESWDEILRNNPVLRGMEADTEALLVNRVRRANEYYLLPIDECYKLVGLIRTRWHGLSGGTEVWEAIGDFFSSLRQRAQPLGAATNA